MDRRAVRNMIRFSQDQPPHSPKVRQTGTPKKIITVTFVTKDIADIRKKV